MNTHRFNRTAVGAGLALTFALVLTLLFANASLASGNGQARWAAIGHDGITPNDVARADDNYVVSFSKPGSVGPNCEDFNTDVHYGTGDALFYVPQSVPPCWVSWFNATNSGLRANVDINALHDECGPTDNFCDIYLSFKSRTRVPGVGMVEPQDVVIAEWVVGTLDTYTNWQLDFDGSDVGLTGNSEKIDGLYVFDPGEEPAELGCATLGLVSTAGNFRVPDQWGGVIWGGGEDVLGFCGSSFGPDTAGYWFLYHDGSAEGMPRNALIGLTHEDGRKAYSRFEFLTKGPFHVDTANGGSSEVFNFFGQTGMYGGPTFNFATQAGTTGKVDSFTVHHTE